MYLEITMATILNFDKNHSMATERKSGVLNKPGSKKLYTDLRYHGQRIVKSSGLDDTPENRQTLYEWVDRQKEKIANGTFVFAKAFPGASAKEKAFYAQLEGREYRPEPENVLFGDYAANWKERFIGDCKSVTKKRDYEQIIEYWLVPHFGNRTFFQLTGVALKEFIQTLVFKDGKKQGQPLSGSRIRNILIPLRAIWEDACEEHRWNLSDPFVYLKKYLPARSKKHPEVFRFDEWGRVMDQIDPYYRPIAETMIMTGMIGSEMAGLRKEDIHQDRIVIQNSIVRNFEKSDLKNEYRKRSLPITESLRRRLDIVLYRSNGEFVFTMKSGRNFDVDSFRKNPWTSAFEKAGIAYKVPYTTRHSFAAWSLTIGVDIGRLEKLMGHASKQMLYEVYGKYREGLETDAGKILDYFGKDFKRL